MLTQSTMTREATPPENPVSGPHKRQQTEKVSQPAKKAKTQSSKNAAVSSSATKNGSQLHRRKSVEIEEVADESESEFRASSPRNPNHILERADEEQDDDDVVLVEKPTKKAVPKKKPTTVPVNVSEGEMPKETEEEELGTVLILDRNGKTHYSHASNLTERLAKSWTSPIYTFFRARPILEYVDGCRVHSFECAAVNCLGQNGRKVKCFLDTGDAKSTGGLHTHAKKCWGADTVKAALATKNLKAAREIVSKQPQADPKRDTTLTAAFERIGKGKVTYSHCQHTYAETRYAFLSGFHYPAD